MLLLSYSVTRQIGTIWSWKEKKTNKRLQTKSVVSLTVTKTCSLKCIERSFSYNSALTGCIVRDNILGGKPAQRASPAFWENCIRNHAESLNNQTSSCFCSLSLPPNPFNGLFAHLHQNPSNYGRLVFPMSPAVNALHLIFPDSSVLDLFWSTCQMSSAIFLLLLLLHTDCCFCNYSVVKKRPEK